MEEIEVDIESDQVNVETLSEHEPVPSETTISVNKESPNPKHRFVRLPLARVKAMMKKDPDCDLLSQDAVFLVTKATEMFIEYLAKESGKQLAQIGKRKTIMKKDVDGVIQAIPQLCFLDGALD